eukprot:TRINITY_DN11843_c0_g1_i1.p2 TRINITY_DN11843_c0_g1~~TRINITY_DN11843_c0_g1_i1.p2  ORF type:complete len:201 (-),score=15.69 TRINITY_DN11843_c0_g1_i1:10-612(-)
MTVHTYARQRCGTLSNLSSVLDWRTLRTFSRFCDVWNPCSICLLVFFFLMIRRPPRSTHCISSAASDVYKRQEKERIKQQRKITPMSGQLTTTRISKAKGTREWKRNREKTQDQNGKTDNEKRNKHNKKEKTCLLYTSDAADDMQCVDLGGRRIIKKKKTRRQIEHGFHTSQKRENVRSVRQSKTLDKFERVPHLQRAYV